MQKTTHSLLALALLLPAAGAAKTVRAPGVEGLCATRISTLAISYARHRFNERRQELARRQQVLSGAGGAATTVAPQVATAAPPGPVGMKGSTAITVTKQKNIAVIEDNGTIFPPPNLFDLGSGGVQFKRGGPGTRAERFFGGISPSRGDRIEIGDDASRAIDLPFTFTFYGRAYTRVFLNSDGNLTFTGADNASTARSLSRFLEGPPRIAVDFLDLDPSVTSGEAGVYLLLQPGMARVTWLDVPEFGVSNSSTFQLTLYPNGRITMGYGEMDAQQGIIGVSPGGPGTINLVDLSHQLPLKSKTDAIAEQFRSVSEIDDMAAAAAVLSAVRDEYDHIVLFADFPVDLDDAFAYHSGVANDIRGIGTPIFDFSNLYGSRGRLESFVQMGSLDNYPRGPNNRIGFSEATGIAILAHEVGHRWLAFPRFIDNQGQPSDDLLGRQLAHWSFLMDSDGSVMEGNDIRDNGDGTFTTVATWQGYSRLDQYLMGYLRPDQVPPFFYVSGSELDPEDAPNTGVVIQGQRRDVGVHQIIAAEGPRVPASDRAQNVIQVAFALLGRQGEPPDLDSIRKVNQYRNRLSTYFREQTGGRGRVATWLRLRRPAAAAAPATGDGAAAGGAGTVGRTPVEAPPRPVRRLDRHEVRLRR
jgi:hypothetical protein